MSHLAGWTAMAGLVVVLSGLLASASLASAPYASSGDAGQVAVSGTSTLHDWTVKTSGIQGSAVFSGPVTANSAAAITLDSIDLTVPVKSLKSTEGSGMDDTMYDALKLKQFPSITYKLTKATLKSGPTSGDPAYHFDTAGQLTVAGTARVVNMDLTALPHDNGQLTITADIPLKMTDFGVKPPTAMLGIIKSGDAIAVKATWQLTVQPTVAGAGK